MSTIPNNFTITFELDGHTWFGLIEGSTINIYKDEVWATTGKIDDETKKVCEASAPLADKVYECFDDALWLAQSPDDASWESMEFKHRGGDVLIDAKGDTTP